MTDNRVKEVDAALVDKVSTSSPPLTSFFTDKGQAMGLGDTVEILTRAAITIEQVSTGSGASLMSVQTQLATPNLLTCDQHYGSVLNLGQMEKKFDAKGSWADEAATQILVELDNYIDANCYKKALIYGGAWNTGSSASYWVNPSGATVSADHVETVLAMMLDQKGVKQENCRWMFRPYGMSAVRRLSAFTPISVPQQADGKLGTPIVGYLHGIPVVNSQNVPDQIIVTISAATVASNVCTATVADGHGIVAGMVISTTGLSTNATSATVTSTTATTIVFALTASNGSVGSGTLTCNLTCNGLMHAPWTFVRKAMVPTLKIVAKSGGYIGDELQFSSIWGAKGLTGGFIGLGSPRRSIS